jgi:hypothetical protein
MIKKTHSSLKNKEMKKKSFIGTVSGSADYHDWKDGIVYWDL